MAIYNREDPRTALPQLEKQLNARIDGLLDFFYPIGCYFETSDTDFDPNSRWGGTWELETEGKVHIGAGDNYTAGSTGGASTVTLDTTMIPAHTHGNKSLSGYFTARRMGANNQSHWGSGIVSVSMGSTANMASAQQDNANQNPDVVTINASHEHTSVGGSQAHNNMQPYIVVNRWHRVA